MRKSVYQYVLIPLLVFFTIGIGVWAESTGSEAAGPWLITETEHFHFIYKERDVQAVKELVSFAEEVYQDVTGLLKSKPETIHCVINGETDAANGFYSPLPPHLTLYVQYPINQFLGARTENWLKALLVHELTHYVHLTYEEGYIAALSTVFGPALKSVHMVPLEGWVVEGITTNTETVFTEGGRGRNPFFEVTYKAPIMENNLFSLKQAEYSSFFPPRGRYYTSGYIIVNHLLETYGMDVFTQIHRKYISSPFVDFYEAIEAVTGDTMQQIYLDMKRTLTRKYAKDLTVKQGTPVTPEIYANYYMPEITDSGWILYRTRLDSSNAIVRFTPQTKSETVLTEVSLYDPNSLTADKTGSRIVFSALKSTAAPDGRSRNTLDLYEYTPSGDTIRPLSEDKHLWQPELSSDGQRLIAVEGTGSYSRLVEVNAESGQVKVLFSMKNTKVYNPALSADGEKIAFVLRNEGVQDVWTMSYPPEVNRYIPENAPEECNTDSARPITGPDAQGDYYPEFTESGNIIFSSDREGSLYLYEYNTENNSYSRIATDPVAAEKGAVEGNSVIYGSYSSRGYVVKKKPYNKIGADELEKPVNFTNNTDDKAIAGTDSGKGTDSDSGESAVSGSSAGENTKDGSADGSSDKSSGSAGLPLLPASIESSRYVDVPRFMAWAPFPAYMDPFTNSISLGAGFAAGGVSTLGGNSWNAIAGYDPEYSQISGRLDAEMAIGKGALSYSVLQGFPATLTGGGITFNQLTSQILRFRYPLFSASVLDVSKNISLSSGILYDFMLSSGSAFSFWESFTEETGSISNSLYYRGGISASISKRGAPFHIYPSRAAAAVLNATVPLPVFAGSSSGVHFGLRTGVSFPFFWNPQIVMLKTNTAYSNVSSIPPSVKPRGFNTVLSLSEGVTMATLEYRFSSGLMDVPLPFGLHVIGHNEGIFLQAAGAWDISSPAFGMHSYIYTGFELTFIGGYKTASGVPVSIGTSFKINTKNPEQFDLLKDIRFYVSSNLSITEQGARTHSLKKR